MVTQRTADDLGTRIDNLRSRAGVSAQKLAADTNIPYATLLRRLAGDGRLTVAELHRISIALGVSASTWFEDAA